MDELIELLTRGGEIEFIFHSRQYFYCQIIETKNHIESILSKLIETGAMQ